MTGAVDPGRNALMLTELRLPTIGQLWPELARRSDKEGWPAGRFLGALLEHELAERAKRRTERHRAESQLDPTKTLASFDFAEVPMLSKAHVMALAGGDAWLDKGATVLIFGPLVWARATSELRHRPRAYRRRLPGVVHAHQRTGSAPAGRPPEPAVAPGTGQARALRATQHPHHSQPAVLRLEQRVPGPRHDGGRHRPLGAPDHSTVFELSNVESYRSKEAAVNRRSSAKTTRPVADVNHPTTTTNRPRSPTHDPLNQRHSPQPNRPC